MVCLCIKYNVNFNIFIATNRNEQCVHVIYYGGSIELTAWHRRYIYIIYICIIITRSDLPIYILRALCALITTAVDVFFFCYYHIVIVIIIILYSDGLALDNSGNVIDVRCTRRFYYSYYYHYYYIVQRAYVRYNSCIVRPRYTPPPPRMRAPARRVPPN